MSKAYVCLADGTEEIEALTVVDLLRRGKVETKTVSVMPQRMITGAHGIRVEADLLFAEELFRDGDLLVLPGGMPGTTHLRKHAGLRTVLEEYFREGRYLAAICAAPSVLGDNGFLKGKRATCYPGFEDSLTGAVLCTERVVRDGTVITSRGLGTAIDFALELLRLLQGEETAEQIARGIQYR